MSSHHHVKPELMQLICREIEAHEGKISFAHFMHLALYTPGLGYYSSGEIKFGKEGDFVTAPELSPLFAQALANQVACLQQSSPKLNQLFEFGAGSGQLALNMMRRLEALDALPERYFILEVSGDLKARQQALLQEALPHLYPRFQWLDRLPESPLNAIVVANEILDAMPVSRFRVGERDIEEAYVVLEDKQLATCWHPASEALKERVLALAPLAEGYQSEVNLNINPWLQSLYDMLETGVVLLIDYGFPEHEYYHPTRSMGTLMCHYRHQANTAPYENLGLQDITAHVDFTHVAMAAQTVGFDVDGYTDQASFLLANGLLDLIERDDDVKAYEQNQQVKTLTMPQEMGELFKVMALSKNNSQLLQGFSLSDKRHSL